MLAPRPAGSVDQLGQTPEAIAARRREERSPGRRLQRRRLLPHGAAGKDAARAGPQATSTWASNVASSTPPESSTHGTRDAASSSSHASRHRARSIDGCVVRELGLENVAADRRQPPGGLDHDLATRLAGQLLAVDEGERERLDEQRESTARQAAATWPTSPSWSAAFDAPGW